MSAPVPDSEEISSLKAEIAKHNARLDFLVSSGASQSSIDALLGVINTRGNTLNALLAQQSASQNGGVEKAVKKSIKIIHPPMAKGEEPKLVTKHFFSDEEFKGYLRLNRGSLIRNEEEVGNINELEEDKTYTWSGPFYTANINKSRREQVDARVLEQDVAMAVQRAIGDDAHIHHNYKFKSAKGEDKAEFDAIIVHQGAEGVPNSVAYIVESSYSPQVGCSVSDIGYSIGEVAVLDNKVKKFKKLASGNKHFGSVSSVVPVLGGRDWDAGVLKKSQERKQWQVQPSGGGYMVVRGLCTRIIRLIK